MADLPKVTKSIEDLRKPSGKRHGRRVLSATIAAIAASVALSAKGAPATQTTQVLERNASPSVERAAPGKLVFEPNDVGRTQVADHYSHSSHSSHSSHHSHYSSR